MRAPRRGMSKGLRFRIFARDRFTCQYCGLAAPNVELQVDHITPLSKGGAHHPSNFTTACSYCNLGKSDLSGVADIVFSDLLEVFYKQHSDWWAEQADDFIGDDVVGGHQPWFMKPKYVRPIYLDFDWESPAKVMPKAAPLPAISFDCWEVF